MVDIRDWIASHAERTPNAIAQIDHATNRSFTYSDMQERVSRIAGFLKLERSVRVGEVIAVLGDNCSDIFDIDFACGRIGAIFLPMNTRLAAPELAFQLADANPKILFVGEGYFEVAETAILESGLNISLISFSSKQTENHLETICETAPTVCRDEPRSGDDGWTLIYSSGTTGRPKGVLHTHSGITMQAIANCVPLGLGPQSCGLTVLPLFHISGLNIFAHAMFYAGATQITMDKFNPTEMLAALANPVYSVTHFSGVPTIFEMMAQLPEFPTADTSSVKGAFVGGAPSTEALLETYARKGMPLIQGYGLTETGPTLTVLSAENAVEKLGSAGKAIMHVDVRVIKEDGSKAEAGEIGEIIAKGPSVITSYFKRPEAQASSFVDGWLRTGDMGKLDEDNFLFIVDRKKDMFISGGENVYPAEVENCISHLEGVVQVSVIGVPDEKWGEVGAACIVKHPDRELSEEDVIQFCDEKIARYKIPKHVFFFDALPLGGTGKVLKSELRELVKTK